MLEWQTAYKELKERYLNQSRSRLIEIGATLKRLKAEPDDAQAVDSVMRHFHWLAGSGGIYGFPEITRVGKEAEALCDAVLKKGRPPSEDELETLTALLESSNEAFSREREQRWVEQATAGRDAQFSVLIVNGGARIHKEFVPMLEEQDVRVRLADDAASCVTEIEGDLPSAVIINLPFEGSSGSGYELVEKIRLLPAGEELIVIIVSQQAGFLDKVQAIHCGADAFFEEPVDFNELAERLRFLLESHQPEIFRVLYVEDDPAQAGYVQTVLSTAGYQVAICAHPREFEDALQLHRPDLILMDIVLPEFSGYELARYVRQQEAFAPVPIVFLTTETRLDSKIIAARAGGDDYLLKPVASTLLLSTVSAKLERARFLKSLLHRDGLTRLLTHSAFMSQAKAIVAKKQRQPEKSVGMVIIDIDRFKSINDTYGHPVGDRVIVALSGLLRRRVRRSDVVGRYGGEEFALIVEDLTEKEVESLATRLLKGFSSIEHHADDKAFHSTFSAGVAMLDSVSMDLAQWIAAADNALLKAKQSGRNQVVCSPYSVKGHK